MPITKSKEDTWKSSELRDQLKSVRFKEASKDKTLMSKAEAEKTSKESRRKSKDDDPHKRLRRKEVEDGNDMELASGDKRRDKNRKRNEAGEGREEPAREGRRMDRDRRRDSEAEKQEGRRREKDKERTKERIRDDDKDVSRHRDKDRKTDGHGDRGKSREKERHKDRDTDKSRERHRDKERERHKDKERDVDRDKERHRDKERESERHKDRNKDVDKDRERHRGREKENHKDKDRDIITDKERERHRDRDREKHRDKDRDVNTEKERHRDRDKERRKEKDRNVDKDGKKHRDEDRDKGRDRHRDRDEDRERHSKRGTEANRQRDVDDEKHKKKRNHHEVEGSTLHRSKHDKGGATAAHDTDDLERMDRKKHKSQGDRHSSEKRNRDEDIDSKKSHGSSRHKSETRNKEKSHDSRNKSDEDEDDDNYDYNYEDDFEVYEDDFEKEASENDDDDDDGDNDGIEIEEDDRKNRKKNQMKPAEEDDDNKYRHDDKKHRHVDSDRGNKKTPGVQSEDQPEGKGQKSTINDLLKAMEEENERLLKSSTMFKKNRGDEESVSAPPKDMFPNFLINFSREKFSSVPSRLRARMEEILKFVELDSRQFDLFTLNPATEYEVFMLKFGNSGYMQTYVQTRDDDNEWGVQTEEIMTRDASTQQPMQFSLKNENLGDAAYSTKEEFVNIDSLSLGKFLSKSVPVMIGLMEESRVKKLFNSSERSNLKTSDIPFAQSMMEFKNPEILKGRPVTSCYFSPHFQHWFLTVHEPPAEMETPDMWTLKGTICMWSIADLSSPFKILVCRSDPTCCCLSPFRNTLAFAGTADGTILLWDLTVPSYMSVPSAFKGYESLLRQPAFNNALLTSTNHRSPVVSIATIEPSKIGLSEKNLSKKDDLDFQVVTLEVDLMIFFWVPLYVSEDQGHDLDAGVTPGGKIKMIQSSVINLTSPRKCFGQPYCQSLQLAILPTNHSHLFVSTDIGRILHVSKNSRKVQPEFYCPKLGYMTEVASMDVSRFEPSLILAGYFDGSLRIFGMQSSRPTAEWMDSTNSRPIRNVAWTKTRPSCFLVADESGHVFIWDLCLDLNGPLSSHNPSSKSRTALVSTAHVELSSLDGLAASLVVMFSQDGTCKIHVLSENFTKWSKEDDEKWKELLSLSEW